MADDDFRKLANIARALHADRLENTLFDVVENGRPSPVYYRGKKVATERKYSDILTIFALKGAKPEKYRERLEVTGADGGPLRVEIDDATKSRKRVLAELAAEMNRLMCENPAPADDDVVDVEARELLGMAALDQPADNDNQADPLDPLA